MIHVGASIIAFSLNVTQLFVYVDVKTILMGLMINDLDLFLQSYGHEHDILYNIIWNKRRRYTDIIIIHLNLVAGYLDVTRFSRWSSDLSVDKKKINK